MALCRLCGVIDTYGSDVCAECSPRNERVAVKLDNRTLMRLRALGERVHMTTPDLIRAAIMEFLDEREKENEQAYEE